MNDAALTIRTAPPAVQLASDAANGNRLAAVARQAIPAGTLLGQYQGRVLQDLRELPNADTINEYVVAVWPRLTDDDSSGTAAIDESRVPWEPLYYIDASSTSHAVAPPPVVISQQRGRTDTRADAWIQSSEQLTNWTRYIRRRRTNTPTVAPPANVALVTGAVRPGRLYAVTARAVAAGEALTFDNEARPVYRRIDVTPGQLRIVVSGEAGDRPAVARHMALVLGVPASDNARLPEPYGRYAVSYGFAVQLAYDEASGTVVGFSVALLGGRVLMAVHVAAPVRNAGEVRGALLADAMDTMRGSDAPAGAHGTFIEVPERQQLAVFGRLDPTAWQFRQRRRPPSWRQMVQLLFWDLVLPDTDVQGTRWQWAMQTLHLAGLSARNRHMLVAEPDRLAVYVAVDAQQRRVAVVVASTETPVIEFMHVRGVFHASRAPLVYRDLLQTYRNLVVGDGQKQAAAQVLRVRARQQSMLAMVLELAGYTRTARGDGPFSLDTYERSL